MSLIKCVCHGYSFSTDKYAWRLQIGCAVNVNHIKAGLHLKYAL